MENPCKRIWKYQTRSQKDSLTVRIQENLSGYSVDEKNNSLTITAEMPGISKEDIKLRCIGQTNYNTC